MKEERKKKAGNNGKQFGKKEKSLEAGPFVSEIQILCVPCR